ncbi:hypothetical protein NQZ79_g7247 [Umbelopsis isabellina]|nr:hypothetical protein NQZ79_g7247 [Umbelopsis isabellina]
MPVVGDDSSHNSTLDRLFDRCIAGLQARLPQYYILISIWLLVLLMGFGIWLSQQNTISKCKSTIPWTPNRPSVWLHRRKVRPTSGTYVRPTAPRPAVTKAIIYRDRYKSERHSMLFSDNSAIRLNVI